MRRLIHVSMIFAPIIYYFYLLPLFQDHSNALVFLLISILCCVVIFEIFRLKSHIIFMGQRDFEAQQFSSFSSAIIAIVLVLGLAPHAAFGFAIIWSCALGDPLLAELRRLESSTLVLFLLGTIFLLFIWYFFLSYYHLSPLWALLAPLIVAVELPKFKSLDDNLLMQLVPLIVVSLCY